MNKNEIIFRGKREDNGEWIEGCLCKSIFEGTYLIMPSPFFATRDFGDLDENSIMSDSIAIGGFYRVIKETISQYTNDIDKDGNKIFNNCNLY